MVFYANKTKGVDEMITSKKQSEKVLVDPVFNLVQNKEILTRAQNDKPVYVLMGEAVYTQLEKEVSAYNQCEDNIVDGIKHEITVEELKTNLNKAVFGSDEFIERYNSLAKTFAFNKTYEDVVFEIYQQESEKTFQTETVAILRKLFNQIDYEVNLFNEEDRFGGVELEGSVIKFRLLTGYKEKGKSLKDMYNDFASHFMFSKSFEDVVNPQRTVDVVFSNLSFSEREALALVVELITLRKKACMPVKELAKKSGVSKKYIKGLEDSTKKFKLEKAIKLADALGMQLKFVSK